MVRMLIAVALALFLATTVLPSPLAAQEQTTRTLKCWKCSESFTAPSEERQGNCPKCGAKFVLPPPTPVPTPSLPPGMKPPPTPLVVALDYTEGMKYVGQTKTFTGPIVGSHFSEKSGNLYLNFDQDYRNNISIKIGKADLSKFPPDAASFYEGKTVVATGRLEKEKNFVRLVVTDPKYLVVSEAGAADAGAPESPAPPADAGAAAAPAAGPAATPAAGAAATPPPAAAPETPGAATAAPAAPEAETAVTGFPAQYGGGAPAPSPRFALPAPTPRKFSWSSQPSSDRPHKKKGSRGHSGGGDSSSD